MVVNTRRKKALSIPSLDEMENEKKNKDKTKTVEDEKCKTDDMKWEDKERERKDEEKERRRKKKEDKTLNVVRRRKPLHVKSTEGIQKSANTEIAGEFITKSTKQNNCSWIIKLVMMMIVITVISLVFLVFFFPEGANMLGSLTADAANPLSKTESFKEKINSLSKSFPTQTPYLWNVIVSVSLDFIQSENPKRPAVILLAGGPDARPTLDALASKLSVFYKNIERTVSVTEIDGMQYRNTNPSATKKYIDDTLKNGFNNGNQVAVIHHLESIPAEASMIFHSYCEHDNAPFKRVVIIFTVHTTEELNPKDNVKMNQKKVQKHLEEQWKDAVDKDHIEAMFSQVATATAFVTP